VSSSLSVSVCHDVARRRGPKLHQCVISRVIRRPRPHSFLSVSTRTQTVGYVDCGLWMWSFVFVFQVPPLPFMRFPVPHFQRPFVCRKTHSGLAVGRGRETRCCFVDLWLLLLLSLMMMLLLMFHYTTNLRSSSTSQLGWSDEHGCPLLAIVRFRFPGSRLWNTLPPDVTSASTLTVFWNHIKTHFFPRSFPSYLFSVSSFVHRVW